MKKYSTLMLVCLCFALQHAQSQNWLTAGNLGLTSGNFLGTTDGAVLNIKVNNQKSGIIEYATTANTAWGYQALRVNAGSGNTSFGYQALTANTSGAYNTAAGSYALSVNTTGGSNCAFGRRAMQFNSTGSNNVALGYSALYYNNTSSSNVAVGNYSMFYNTGYGNVGVGTYALYKNTNGEHNTAIGDSAFYNGIGSGNTASGAYTMLNATNCDFNTADGFGAMLFNTSGSSNTASGHLALGSNTTGSYNTAAGSYALASNSTGSYNSAFGAESGAIGSYSNTSALGYNADVDANNKIRLGNASVTSIGGQVGWSVFSDARIKKDIKENVPGLAFINALRPVTYHYMLQKQNELLGVKNDTAQWEGKNDIEKINFTGLLAQEVEAAAKKLNYDFSGVDKTGKIMALRYSDFVTPLIKAVQELSSVNNDLKNELNKQQSVIHQLLAENSELGQRIAKLESMMNIQAATVNNNQQTATANNTMLGQNFPNPCNSTTAIQVKLPGVYTNGQLIISDKTGNIIKKIILNNSSSNISLDVAALASGTYQYSLYVNGKLQSTKQMVVAK